MMAFYDICVVGAGTMGSAAARHVTLLEPNAKLLLIGPFERKDRSSIDIHGTYYDKGRMTRPIDVEPAWAKLGQRSIARYRQIERQSGIQFYGEVGYLCTGKQGQEFITTVAETTARDNIPFKKLSKRDMSRFLPYFDSLSDDAGVYVEKNAGYVNIREMVDAERKLARLAGCDIQDDVIRTITPPSATEEYYRLETDAGRVYYSRKVLLATGAFTSCRNLLPPGVVPDVTLRPISVILVEVSEAEAARMRQMPTILVGGRAANTKWSFDSYILPPIKYPDGKIYLKVGHGADIDAVPLQTPAEIHSWFNRTEVGYTERLVYNLARKYFPDISLERHKYDHCVITNTPHGLPFIEMLTPTLGVLLAGNGRSAKCADELGHVAARMIIKGEWDSDLPRDSFRFINKHQQIPSKL